MRRVNINTPADTVNYHDVLNDVAYYRRQADYDGMPHDPEWDQWEREAKAKLAEGIDTEIIT